MSLPLPANAASLRKQLMVLADARMTAANAAKLLAYRLSDEQRRGI